MTENEEVEFQATQKYLHRILKNQENLEPDTQSFLNSLLLFEQPIANPTPIVEILESHLYELSIAGRYADLLRRRFWMGETIRQVAHAFHLSTDQINRIQREAIDALTRVILEKEKTLRNAKRGSCTQTGRSTRFTDCS